MNRVMVNNSTNVNKTNNHLSPQTIGHRKRPRPMTLGIMVLAWEIHKNMAVLIRY